MKRRVLLIAYYFPPLGLSGVQRVTKFAKFLPDFAWDVSVLTVKPRSYFAYDESLLADLDRPEISIHRTASLDPTRFFGGKKVGVPSEGNRRLLSGISQAFFQPDNKIGWFPFAVREGKRLLREQTHHAILASAPPYTGHLIGARLSRMTDLPLVLDYRDDWVDNPRHTYPTKWHRQKAENQERRSMSQASAIVSINRTIRNLVARRAGALLPEDNHHVLSHGYDPDEFGTVFSHSNREKMEILYTGVFYDAQQPDTFLKGFQKFLTAVPEARNRVVCTFIGLLPDSALKLITDLDLNDCVNHLGYLPHTDTVQAMKNTDVLWMTIGNQPGSSGISTGKLYEYIGTAKPILGLVPEGVARETLKSYGASEIVPPDDEDGAASALKRLFEHWDGGSLPEPDASFVSGYDRRLLASQLAEILNNATMSASK